MIKLLCDIATRKSLENTASGVVSKNIWMKTLPPEPPKKTWNKIDVLGIQVFNKKTLPLYHDGFMGLHGTFTFIGLFFYGKLVSCIRSFEASPMAPLAQQRWRNKPPGHLDRDRKFLAPHKMAMLQATWNWKSWPKHRIWTSPSQHSSSASTAMAFGGQSSIQGNFDPAKWPSRIQAGWDPNVQADCLDLL